MMDPKKNIGQMSPNFSSEGRKSSQEHVRERISIQKKKSLSVLQITSGMQIKLQSCHEKLQHTLIAYNFIGCI